MLVNGKELQQTPVFTTDKVRYRYVDTILDRSGQHIEALVVKHPSLLSSDEYLIPISGVKEIVPENGIYLNVKSTDMETYDQMPKFAGFHSYANFIELDAKSHINSNSPNKKKPNEAYSLNQIIRFKVECIDEKLGQVRNIFFHPVTYLIHYYAVAINRGFSKRWAFIASHWLEGIDWSQRIIYLNTKREDVVMGPLYRPRVQITDSMEQILRSQSQKLTPSKSYSSYNDEAIRPVDL